MIERQYDLSRTNNELLLFFCIDKCTLDSLLASTYHHDCSIKRSANVPGCLSKIYMYTAGYK